MPKEPKVKFQFKDSYRIWWEVLCYSNGVTEPDGYGFYVTVWDIHLINQDSGQKVLHVESVETQYDNDITVEDAMVALNNRIFNMLVSLQASNQKSKP